MTEAVLQNNAPTSHLAEKDLNLRDSHEDGKEAIDSKEPAVNESERSNSIREEVEYQWGVQKARAITTIWDNRSKWTLFIM